MRVTNPFSLCTTQKMILFWKKHHSDRYIIYKRSHQRTQNVVVFSKTVESTGFRPRFIPAMAEQGDDASIHVEAGISNITMVPAPKWTTIQE